MQAMEETDSEDESGKDDSDDDEGSSHLEDESSGSHPDDSDLGPEDGEELDTSDSMLDGYSPL